MPVVLIVNPKGGVGKSTVATNLAGWFAARGHATMLGDLDRQQSALGWLARRPPTAPRIHTWELDAERIARPPRGITHVVLDAPAAIHGQALKEALRAADRIVVPLQASLFDICATQAFVDKLAARLGEKCAAQAGVLGVRVDARTRAAEQLRRFVAGLHLPVLGFLRDTQNYVQLAAHGLTLWDVAPARVEKDLAQWQPLLAWLETGVLPPAASDGGD